MLRENCCCLIYISAAQCCQQLRRRHVGARSVRELDTQSIRDEDTRSELDFVRDAAPGTNFTYVQSITFNLPACNAANYLDPNQLPPEKLCELCL